MCQLFSAKPSNLALMGNDPIALDDTFDDGGKIDLIDVSRRRPRVRTAQNHEHVIADDEWQLVGLLSIGQQDAGTRGVNLERRSRDHKLRMDSRSARITVRRLHRHESAFYPGDAALNYERPGRGRLRLGLGSDRKALHAAQPRQENP